MRTHDFTDIRRIPHNGRNVVWPSALANVVPGDEILVTRARASSFRSAAYKYGLMIEKRVEGDVYKYKVVMDERKMLLRLIAKESTAMLRAFVKSADQLRKAKA